MQLGELGEAKDAISWKDEFQQKKNDREIILLQLARDYYKWQNIATNFPP